MVSWKSSWFLPCGISLGVQGVSRGFGEAAIPQEDRGWLPSALYQDSPLAQCPLSQPPWQQQGMMSLTSQACQRNPTAPHVPRYHHSSTVTLCPAVCTLVAQAMGTGSGYPLQIRCWGRCDFTCKWWLGWRQLPPVRYKRRCFACHKGGRVRVCVHVNKSGQHRQQSTPRLLPLPCPTGGTRWPGSE